MGKRTTLYGTLILVLVLASCGTKKIADGASKTINASHYPYIEKFHNAQRLKAKGRIDEAIKELEYCLSIRQDDDAVYYALSKLENLRNNGSQSAKYIEQAAALDPDNIWYTQELAYMHYETKNFEKAAENFKKLTDKEPRNVDWLYGYAETLVQTGQAQKAIEALSKTEDQVGKHPELSMKKYNLYMSLKKIKEAEEELLSAWESFPLEPMVIATLTDHYFKTEQIDKAVNMLEELVKADPGNGRAHLTLADIYRQQGDQKRAYSELKLAFESSDVDLDTKMKILIRIHENSFKIDPEVYELVDLLVSQYPNEAKSYSIKGDYLLRQENDLEALAAYKQALTFDKSQYPIWNQVLLMEYQQSQFNALYSDSKEALSLFPSVASVYLLHGLAANQLKKYNEALEVLNTGVDLVVNDTPLKSEFMGQLGEAHFGLGSSEQGTTYYNKAIGLSPESLLLKNNFAYRLASSKTNLDLAEKLILEAIAAAPQQAQYLDTYGWIYFQRGDFLQAKTMFTKAYELLPGDRQILEHLGDVHYKLNNAEKAMEWWLKAQQIDGNNALLNKKITDKKYHAPLD